MGSDGGRVLGRVEPLVPRCSATRTRSTSAAPGEGRWSAGPDWCSRRSWRAQDGCQWKALPAERFGSASAVHQKFMDWSKADFFTEEIWKAGLAEYNELEGISWRWQSGDGAMFKAPLGKRPRAEPTDRGKNGSKRHLLVDGRGVLLSLVVTGANVHDVTQIETVLDAIVVKRRLPSSAAQTPVRRCGLSWQRRR